jgi:hypothetical protein
MSWWVVNQVSRPGGPRGPQQTNYIIEQAAARPVNTVAGPYSTKADAQAWQTGANTAGNSPGSAAGGAVNAAADATGLTGVTGFLAKLGTRQLWTRIAKVVAGLALVLVGVVQLTHTEKLIATVGKAAALA